MLKRDSFYYIGEKTEFSDSVGNLKIRDMRCKHVCSLESFKAQELLRASEAIGYRECMWGEWEGYGNHPELNQTVNRSRIQRFIYDKIIHPVRVVADEEGVLWIDNLHSAIAQVISRGDDCTLAEIPHYIIRSNEESGWTEVYDPYRIVDLNKLYGALTVADKRLSRVDGNVRNVHYTIGEFMKENNMDREHMTLSFKYYDDFNDTTDRIITDRTGEQQI